MKAHAAACGAAARRQAMEFELADLRVLLFTWRHTAP